MVFPGDWGWRLKITSDSTKVSASIKGLAYDLSNITSAEKVKFEEEYKFKDDGSEVKV